MACRVASSFLSKSKQTQHSLNLCPYKPSWCDNGFILRRKRSSLVVSYEWAISQSYGDNTILYKDSSYQVQRCLATSPRLNNAKKQMKEFTMELLNNEKKDIDIESNTVEFTKTLLRCFKFWTYDKTKNSTKNAKEILDRLIQQIHTSENIDVNLSRDIIQCIETFLMKLKNHSSPDRFIIEAKEIVERLEKSCEVQNAGLKPSLKMYNIILDSLTRNRQRGQGTVKEMEQIMIHMENKMNISPDSTSYNSVLQGLSRERRNGAMKCESFLRSMKDDEKLRHLLNTVSFNIVINAWSKHDYSNSKVRDVNYSALRAEGLLREMQREYTEGNSNVKPNLISFTSVMNAWSRISSKDIEAAERAQGIFRLLCDLGYGDESFKPNSFAYHTVMNAWANSSLPDSPEMASRLLNQMLDRYEAGDVDTKPSVISFSIAIKAWANSDKKKNSSRALQLLHQMNGFDGVTADIGVYNSVLRAIANDVDMSDKLDCIGSLLMDITSGGLQPDLNTFNNILRCCATTRSNDTTVKRNALKVASETLLSIKNSHRVQPDPYTFNFFIKICDRHAEDKEKLKLIQIAFKFCTEVGQLSPPVLSLMKNTLAPKDLRRILQIGDDVNLRSLKIENLPSQWSSAVK